jgi:hypothetical protein
MSCEEIRCSMGREKGRVNWKISQRLEGQQRKAYGWFIVCLCDCAQRGMGDQKGGAPGCSGICPSTVQKEWTGLIAGIVSDFLFCNFSITLLYSYQYNILDVNLVVYYA